MICPRCHGEIHVPDDFAATDEADYCDALFICFLLHSRDDCTAPQHNHLNSGVYAGCPACGTDLPVEA